MEIFETSPSETSQKQLAAAIIQKRDKIFNSIKNQTIPKFDISEEETIIHPTSSMLMYSYQPSPNLSKRKSKESPDIPAESQTSQIIFQ